MNKHRGWFSQLNKTKSWSHKNPQTHKHTLNHKTTRQETSTHTTQPQRREDDTQNEIKHIYKQQVMGLFPVFPVSAVALRPDQVLNGWKAEWSQTGEACVAFTLTWRDHVSLEPHGPPLSETGEPISTPLWCLLLLPRLHASYFCSATAPTPTPTHRSPTQLDARTHTHLWSKGTLTQGCIWRWRCGHEPDHLVQWPHVENILDNGAGTSRDWTSPHCFMYIFLVR